MRLVNSKVIIIMLIASGQMIFDSKFSNNKQTTNAWINDDDKCN